jgi:hypothetical protein
MGTDPTARALPTDELADAEDSLRHQSERDRESLVIDRDELRALLAEYDRRGARLESLSLLRHYLGTIANRIGRPTKSLLRQVGEIEEVGEGVLAELERLRARVDDLEPIAQRAHEVQADPHGWLSSKTAARYIVTGEA